MTITDNDITIEHIQRIANEIGNTPILDLSMLSHHPDVKILAKQEWLQLSGSVKARAAFEIIKDAMLSGALKGKTLLDASSGNTGIAYAAIGKALGIKVCIVLPENASTERKNLIQSYGADYIFSSAFGGTDEAQALAKEIAEYEPFKYFYADQYNNDNNWKAHYNGTSLEIIEQSNDRLTHFICGLGSCGTFTGVAKRLEESHPEVQRIALQPNTPMHGMEGWKHLETAKVPGVLQRELIHEIQTVDSLDALEMIKTIYTRLGLKLSPSSAANIVGAVNLSKTLTSGCIVTMLPDNADKYSEILSTLNLTNHA